MTALVVALIATGCGGTAEPEPDAAGSPSDTASPTNEPEVSNDPATPTNEPTASDEPETPTAEPDVSDEPRTQKGADRTSRPSTERKTRKPTPTPSATPQPQPQTRFLVTRVIDGDTLEIGTGQDVRLVGIDTPEVGECGYDKATANLAYLVEGKTVLLTRSDEDTDRYGRLLRYVNIGTTDAGLRLIKNGHAIARYDSRDGYGFHQREPVYIAADKASPKVPCAPPPPPPAPAPAGGACASGYSPCIPPFPPDVDCGDVNGPISVTGTDPHGLDADGDGTACE